MSVEPSPTPAPTPHRGWFRRFVDALLGPADPLPGAEAAVSAPKPPVAAETHVVVDEVHDDQVDPSEQTLNLKKISPEPRHDVPPVRPRAPLPNHPAAADVVDDATAQADEEDTAPTTGVGIANQAIEHIEFDTEEAAFDPPPTHLEPAPSANSEQDGRAQVAEHATHDPGPTSNADPTPSEPSPPVSKPVAIQTTGGRAPAPKNATDVPASALPREKAMEEQRSTDSLQLPGPDVSEGLGGARNRRPHPRVAQTGGRGPHPPDESDHGRTLADRRRDQGTANAAGRHQPTRRGPSRHRRCPPRRGFQGTRRPGAHPHTAGRTTARASRSRHRRHQGQGTQRAKRPEEPSGAGACGRSRGGLRGLRASPELARRLPHGDDRPSRGAEGADSSLSSTSTPPVTSPSTAPASTSTSCSRSTAKRISPSWSAWCSR